MHHSLSSLFRLLYQRAADVDSFIAEHLQGELDGSIFGLAHTTVRQLSDQHRLRADSWFNHEIKSTIRKLLGNALRAESLHLLSPSVLIRRKEETLALIIESHTTQLHMLAAIIIHLLILSLFHKIFN